MIGIGTKLEIFENMDILFKVQETLDLVTDLIWLSLVVEALPFKDSSDYSIVSGLARFLCAFNLLRLLSTTRSRRLIRGAGLEGSKGAKFREVIYAAQQVVFEDVPSICLAGYVTAYFLVHGSFTFIWPLVTLFSVLISEISFVKFGRAMSLAGFERSHIKIAPMLLLAFMPPGLDDSAADEPEGHYFWFIAENFDDEGDGSIKEINDVLRTRYL